MRTKFLLFLTLSLLFSSCKKDDPVKSGDLYELRFNLGGFSQVMTGQAQAHFSEDGASLLDYIQFLYYEIYDSGGAKVNYIRQVGTDAGFGRITDQVTSGEYTIILLGSKYDVMPGPFTTLAGSKVTSKEADGDLFFKKIQITVNGSNIDQEIRLEHVVSGLELNVEDALPAAVTRVEMSVADECPVFSFSSGAVVPGSGTLMKKVSKTISSDADRNNLKMEMLILNDQTPISVQIVCYGADGKNIKSVTIPNVRCARDKKTILSGKLFEMFSGGFSVSIGPVWQEEPVVINF